MRRECWDHFPCQRLHKKPLVSDPDMHHGTCVTHVPWCMSGLLTRGGGENVPCIPGACATHNFMVRGQWRYCSLALGHRYDLFTRVLEGCFTGTGPILWLIRTTASKHVKQRLTRPGPVMILLDVIGHGIQDLQGQRSSSSWPVHSQNTTCLVGNLWAFYYEYRQTSNIMISGRNDIYGNLT